MTILTLRKILMTVLLASQGQSNVGGATGSVSGVVLDAHGVGIPDARVYDAPMGSVRIGKDHFVTTNLDGRFVLAGVPAGKTMVIATKTEANYPDARFALYAGNEILPVVEVPANQAVSGVVVKLLAKGGRISGRILDARTRQHVSKARITLSRVDHPEWFLETDPESNGTFQFVVPDRPMHLRVEAAGYKPWVYEGVLEKPKRLKLAPGETRNLDINLQPTK